MTKYSNSIYTKALILMLALAIAPRYANAQADGTILLLQQSPPNGGAISPAVGVHTFDRNADVTLTATPKPGYQFVYWLGDVSDTTASTTTAYLDTPKIIIAVFERVKYDFAFFEELPPSRSGGGGGGQPSRSSADYSGPGGFGGPGGRRPHKYYRPSYEPPEIDDDQDDFPVPGDIDDFPVPDPEPIPEPATGLLLALGAFLARSKRKRKNTGIN
ncbi:MAG: PEP-CTERM sorting domain-containing protein [Sedimentisphaerales bacterium]|nr:PEP-CTERM sorting domain-containing protein [Sedimentisphaerales bacterium]